MNVNRWLHRALYLCAALLLVWLTKTAYHYVKISGVLEQHQAVLANRCQKIPLTTDAKYSLGTEDIAVDRETGLVMISAMNRFEYATPNQDPVDGIYGMTLSSTGSYDAKELKLLSTDSPERFHPHGLSFWSGKSIDGSIEKRLFVVNHRSHSDKTIEIFRVTTDLKLQHIDTVTSPEIYSPNDVVGVSENTFYVSNDRGRGGGVLEAIERLLFLPRSNVVYFDGEEARTVVDGQIFANGIAASSDYKTIYLSNASAQKVKAFEVQQDFSLEHSATFSLNTGPDNLDVAEDGSLWTGAHPKLFDYLNYVQRKQPFAPSQVVRIDPITGISETILYTEDGELSASSAAVTFAGRLFVGSVFEGAILNCPYSRQ